MRRVLDGAIRDGLSPTAFALAVLFAVFTVSHPLLLHGPIRTVMTAMAASTAAALGALGFALRYKAIPATWAHPLAYTIAMLVWGNSQLHLSLSSEPYQTTNLMLLVLGAGCSFLAYRWLLLVIAPTVAGWCLVASDKLGQRIWIHFGFALLSASFLSVVVLNMRIRTFCRLYSLQLERERVREQLQKAHEQLQISAGECGEALADTVKTMAAHMSQRKQMEETLLLTEKLAATGRLAATIAHEINNPLEAAINMTYLAKNQSSDPGVHEYLQQVDEELCRVSHLTKQTLGFYRNTSARVPLALPEVVNGVLSLYSSRIKARAIRVIKTFDCNEEVLAVPGEMRQALANLVANAVDAMPEGGTLRLQVSKARSWHNGGLSAVRVSVADTGTGIPAQLQTKLFQPFFTTKQDVGTGLGLWVTKEIVEKHSGLIRVRSSVRAGCSGTVFSILLPTIR